MFRYTIFLPYLCCYGKGHLTQSSQLNTVKSAVHYCN